MSKSIIVIGAGASGMTAAIAAARQGSAVTILEAQERPGKKLLVTGNGRCNLTNRSKSLSASYYGTGASLAASLTEKFGAEASLQFFSGLGLFTQEKNGCVYPYTLQAVSVLDVLLAELRRLHVNLKFNQKILRITDRGKEEQAAGRTGKYEIETPGWTYEADAVVLACGSMAAPSTGASGEGYLLAQMLGHEVVRVRPALVPLTSDFPYLNRFAGIRCRAKLTLLLGSSPVAEETGELQWTKYGISGIAAFQLSRFVSVLPDQNAAGEDSFTLQIDLLPDYSLEELEAVLTSRAEELGRETASILLRGIVQEKMIRVLLDCASGQAARLSQASLFGTCCADLTPADLSCICRVIKAFSVPVSGTRSFDQAQVCAGGVSCREVTDQLESRLHKGLYFAGELLDVDGPCGGYNLQWAWTSGYTAGTAAGRMKKDACTSAVPGAGWEKAGEDRQ